MPSLAPASLGLPEGLYSSPDMSVEERSRRGYLALCIVIMVPILFGFAADDVNHGRFGEAIRGSVTALGLLTTLLLLRRWSKVWLFFRFTLLMTIALVFHQLAIGSSDGVAFLWLYSIPLIVFFTFGKKEGGAWMTGVCALLSLLFFGNFGLYPYASPLILRFLTTFVIVSLLAFGLEAYRYRYYQQLLAEKTSLEAAVAQVKVLRGLLPICASCKRIRDDDGYWSQIDTYISRHSEAEFQRGVCPDCRGETPDQPSRDRPSRDKSRGTRATPGL